MRTPLPSVTIVRWNTLTPWPTPDAAPATWSDARRKAEQQRAIAREDLVEALFHAAGEFPDGSAGRARLIAARRRIRSGRDADNLAPLPPSTAEAAARFPTASAAIAALDKDLDALIPRALAAERAELTAVLQRPEVHDTALLQSPDLAEALSNQVSATKAGRLSKSRLRSERRLLDYAYRSTLRTSPYGRLTTIAVIPSGHSPSGTTSSGPGTVVHLDFHTQDQIRAATSPPELIRAAASCRRVPDSGKLQFTRIAGGEAQLVTLPETAVVRDLLALTELGPVPPATVVAYLVDAGHGEKHALDAAVATCVSNGLLVPAGAGGAAPLIDSFCANDPLGKISARIASSTGTERATALTTAHRAVEQRAEEAGRPLQPVFYEDALGAASEAPTPPPRMRRRLRPALQMCSVFDRNLDLRLISTALAYKRIGKDAAPLVSTARAVVEQSYTVLGLVSSRTLSHRDLCSLVSSDYADVVAFRQSIEERVAQAAIDEPTEIRIGEQEVTELLSSAPSAVRAFLSVSYAAYAQRCGDRLVLNDAYAGSGAMIARFLHPEIAEHRTAITQMRTAIESWEPRPVQDMDLHSLSVNRVPQLTERCMDAEMWRGLTMRVRPDRMGLSFETAEGEPVAPLVLGAGMPERHPFPIRLIGWNLLGGRLVRTPMHAVHARRLEAGGIHKAPRLVIGDVVAARSRWTGIEELKNTLKTAGRGPADRYRAYTELVGREGLPTLAFVKHDPLVRATEPAPKPLFVDAGSVLSVTTLPERLGGSGRFTHLEECLPTPVPGRAVAEYVVHVDLGDS